MFHVMFGFDGVLNNNYVNSTTLLNYFLVLKLVFLKYIKLHLIMLLYLHTEANLIIGHAVIILCLFPSFLVQELQDPRLDKTCSLCSSSLTRSLYSSSALSL